MRQEGGSANKGTASATWPAHPGVGPSGETGLWCGIHVPQLHTHGPLSTACPRFSVSGHSGHEGKPQAEKGRCRGTLSLVTGVGTGRLAQTLYPQARRQAWVWKIRGRMLRVDNDKTAAIRGKHRCNVMEAFLTLTNEKSAPKSAENGTISTVGTWPLPGFSRVGIRYFGGSWITFSWGSLAAGVGGTWVQPVPPLWKHRGSGNVRS